jgi:hypothetical protein
MPDFLPMRTSERPVLWASGRFAVRVEGPRGGPVEVRRPYAVLGRDPGCDVCLLDPEVAERQVYLHLDRRGLFAVDLASRSGSRVGPSGGPAGWLRPGDALWAGGTRVVVTLVDVDGAGPAGVPPGDPLGGGDGRPLVRLALYPQGSGSPLVLHSELVFLGRSPACGVTVSDPAAAAVHCVLVRSAGAAYVVDLAGRDVTVGGRPVDGCGVLRDGDALGIGGARLECLVRPAAEGRAGPPAPSAAPPCPAASAPMRAELVADPVPPLPVPPAHLLAPGAQGQLVAWLVGMLQATQGELLRRQEVFQRDVHQALRRLQSEQAGGFREQLDRVEDLHREVAGLKEEIRRRYGDGAGPPARRGEPAVARGTGTPAPADDGATAAWVMRRIEEINREAAARGRGRKPR